MKIEYPDKAFTNLLEPHRHIVHNRKEHIGFFVKDYASIHAFGGTSCDHVVPF